MRKLAFLLMVGSLAGVLSSCAGYIAEVVRLPNRYDYENFAASGYCYQLERHYHAVQPCCIVGKADLRLGSPVVCACVTKPCPHSATTTTKQTSVSTRSSEQRSYGDAAYAGGAGK